LAGQVRQWVMGNEAHSSKLIAHRKLRWAMEVRWKNSQNL
jgi:hypothetical protein